MMDAAAKMCAVCGCQLDSASHLTRCQSVAPMFCATPGVPLPDSGSAGPVPASQAAIQGLQAVVEACQPWQSTWVPLAEYRRVEAERDEAIAQRDSLMETALDNATAAASAIKAILASEQARAVRIAEQEHVIAELRAQLAAVSPPASVVATIGAPPCVAKPAGPLGSGHTSDPPPMPFNAICYSR